MRKPIHPIRKMQQAIWESNRVWDVDPVKEAEAIARHVKPLLDALEECHRKLVVEGDHEYCDESCVVKKGQRLLAAWRAKL